MTTPVLRLFAALTLLAGGAAAQQGTALYPFHEDFEAGALEAWWTSGGDGTEPVLLSQVQEPFDGSQHLNVGGIFGEGSQSAWVQLEIDLAQRSGVLIDFRMRHARDLEEALFIQLTMADDRAIEATYAAGKLVHQR